MPYPDFPGLSVSDAQELITEELYSMGEILEIGGNTYVVTAESLKRVDKSEIDQQSPQRAIDVHYQS